MVLVLVGAVAVVVSFVAGFAVGHAGPASKLASIQSEIVKVDGSVSNAAQKVIDKIKSIL